jgi:ADP-ribosylglycohydrolase.
LRRFVLAVSQAEKWSDPWRRAFSRWTSISPPSQGGEGMQAGQFTSPDIVIEPAWKVSLVYGMPCAIYHQLPAAYYLASRFREDYEAAVLHAINGGGQNMSRALLTGALVGAQVGLEGIPHRFITGLRDAQRYQALAAELEQWAVRQETL